MTDRDNYRRLWPSDPPRPWPTEAERKAMAAKAKERQERLASGVCEHGRYLSLCPECSPLA